MIIVLFPSLRLLLSRRRKPSVNLSRESYSSSCEVSSNFLLPVPVIAQLKLHPVHAPSPLLLQLLVAEYVSVATRSE